MPGPRPVAVQLSAEEHARLEVVSTRPSMPQQIALRARIVLAAATVCGPQTTNYSLGRRGLSQVQSRINPTQPVSQHQHSPHTLESPINIIHRPGNSMGCLHVF